MRILLFCVVATAAILGPSAAPAGASADRARQQADEDFRRLCALWRKTEPRLAQGKGPVTDQERALLLKELGRKGDRHDFPRMAAIALGNLRAKEAVPRLIALLNDRSQYHMVSAESARALGKIADMRALPHLLKALEDNRIWVREHSADALRALSPGSDELKALADGKMFRSLLKALDAFRLPDANTKRRYHSPMHCPVVHAARAVDAICTGILLVQPPRLDAADRRRAAVAARRILSCPFEASEYDSPAFARMARFCRTYQPELYAERLRATRPALPPED